MTLVPTCIIESSDALGMIYNDIQVRRLSYWGRIYCGGTKPAKIPSTLKKATLRSAVLM